MSRSEETVPNWEASKENVLPIKRGRSVKVLTENLGTEKSNDNGIKLREKIFHDKILNAADNPSELFEVYVTYLKWTRDTFQSNNEKAMKILEVPMLHISILCSLCQRFTLCNFDSLRRIVRANSKIKKGSKMTTDL